MTTDALGAHTTRTITLRLMPLFAVMYLIAYIDRQNVSYAKLQMVDALGLSEAAYGLGASLFFVGYFLFEAPANLILAKVGARAWFARIMFTWGLVTIALGFVSTAEMFYLLRFLLGVAEAGFFPGVLYALTLWYPQGERARVVGLFLIASAAANALGAALGGALLDLDGLLGFAGWQWVFVATGIPAVALAPVVFFVLPNAPEAARWLSAAQKAWLREALAAEARAAPAPDTPPWRALLDGRVLLLAALFFGMPLGAYGLSYWLPTIVQSFGVSNTVNGLLNIIPWALVAAALWVWPAHATRHGPTRWHIAAPLAVAAAALLGSVLAPHPALQFALLCLAAPAIFAPQPVFWSLPQGLLRGAHAAAGIAAINSIGNLGGFVAQNAVPLVQRATDSTLAPMAMLAAALAATSIAVALIAPRLAPHLLRKA